jgi:integrase
MNARLKAGHSATTVRYHRRLLVARNVASLTDTPKAKKFEIETITPEQARSFFETIKGDRLEAFFAVALSPGLRRGEALGLRWIDIDFESRTLHVCQTLQRLDHELYFSEPKTKNSMRLLAMPDTLVSKLREHRTRQLEEKLAAGEHWQDTGLVFTTNAGTPIDPRNVKRKLDAILKAAKLPHCRVHDFAIFRQASCSRKAYR